MSLDNLSELRKEAVKICQEFIEVNKEFNLQEKRKHPELINKYIREIEDFFKEEGYRFEYQDNIIKAKNNEKIVELTNDSKDTILFNIIIKRNKLQSNWIYGAIEVKPCLEDEKNMLLMTPININRTWLRNDNYEKLINLSDYDQLQNAIKTQIENIKYTKNAIENINKIKYNYFIYNTEREFNSFSEAYKDIEKSQ